LYLPEQTRHLVLMKPDSNDLRRALVAAYEHQDDTPREVAAWWGGAPPPSAPSSAGSGPLARPMPSPEEGATLRSWAMPYAPRSAHGAPNTMT
jgi:hypothetical protein